MRRHIQPQQPPHNSCAAFCLVAVIYRKLYAAFLIARDLVDPHDPSTQDQGSQTLAGNIPQTMYTRLTMPVELFRKYSHRPA
jgi:hypothetical protein